MSSTIPFQEYSGDWNEARHTHFNLFAKLIKDMLDACCRKGGGLTKRVLNLLPDCTQKERNSFQRAIESSIGQKYFTVLNDNHNDADKDKNVLTGSAEYLLKVIGEVLDVCPSEIFYYTPQKPQRPKTKEVDAFLKCKEITKQIFNYPAFRDGKIIKCS